MFFIGMTVRHIQIFLYAVLQTVLFLIKMDLLIYPLAYKFFKFSHRLYTLYPLLQIIFFNSLIEPSLPPTRR